MWSSGLVIDTEQYIWDYPIRVGVVYDLLFVKQKAPELVHTLTLNDCRNIKAGGSLIKAVGRMKSY